MAVEQYPINSEIEPINLLGEEHIRATIDEFTGDDNKIPYAIAPALFALVNAARSTLPPDVTAALMTLINSRIEPAQALAQMDISNG